MENKGCTHVTSPIPLPASGWGFLKCQIRWILCPITLPPGVRPARTPFSLLILDWLFGSFHSCRPRHSPPPCPCYLLCPASCVPSLIFSSFLGRGAGLGISSLILCQIVYAWKSGLEIIFFQNFEGYHSSVFWYQLLMFLFRSFTRICFLCLVFKSF